MMENTQRKISHNIWRTIRKKDMRIMILVEEKKEQGQSIRTWIWDKMLSGHNLETM